MVVGAKVCELTDGFLWFVCGLYVGILTSPLMTTRSNDQPRDNLELNTEFVKADQFGVIYMLITPRPFVC